MEDDNERPGVELEPVQEMLADGLERCRALVEECREQLAGAMMQPGLERPLFRWDEEPRTDPRPPSN